MRRHKTHVVTRGHLRGEGKTKAEAKADLERQIDFALSHVNGMWIETRFGCVLIAVPTLTGFETKVLFPDNMLDHGKRHWSGCHMSGEVDLKTVVMGLRLHAAQCAWTVDYDDSRLIADSGLEKTGELESWIAFQRSYIAHKANGASDRDAHAMACQR